jgi:hypothetical protein
MGGSATALRRFRPVLEQLVRRFRLRDNVERFFDDLRDAMRAKWPN